MSILISIYSKYSMYAIYILIGIVFLAVFLLILSIGLLATTRKSVRSTVASKLSYYSIHKEEKVSIPSFSDRVIMPILSKIASAIRKISPKGIVESTKHKLELAGILETVGVNIYLMIKFLFAIVFLIIFVLLSIFLDLSLIITVILIALIPLSYFFPDIYLRNKINNRQDEIRRMLPNALDMLTITVEAGMGFDIALSKVASNIRGPLGEEFNKVLKEMNIGLSRREAFRNLTRRTNVPDLDTFVTSVIQAEVLGISVGKILRIQSSEIRNRRSIKAEEAGIKAPVKLIFPLVFCLMPALMVVIIGPGLIMVYESLLNILK